tara:strand:- start:762 stop:950 length:189 start_codon:yes stop_codon:yes gene_type:complete
MSDTDYLIINPLQIELTSTNSNDKIKLTEIEKRFYDRMEELKNRSLQNKQLRYIIHHIKHRL